MHRLQNKINGILGIWVIALAFLGFSDSMRRFLLILTGIAISVISFAGKSIFKSTKELAEESKKIEKDLESEVIKSSASEQAPKSSDFDFEQISKNSASDQQSKSFVSEQTQEVPKTFEPEHKPEQNFEHKSETDSVPEAGQKQEEPPAQRQVL